MSPVERRDVYRLPPQPPIVDQLKARGLVSARLTYGFHYGVDGWVVEIRTMDNKRASWVITRDMAQNRDEALLFFQKQIEKRFPVHKSDD